jgi:hypothetical protein
MITRTDISITLFHKDYFELNPDEKNKVDRAYDAHQTLNEDIKNGKITMVKL